jgi:hypothetical protein
MDDYYKGRTYTADTFPVTIDAAALRKRPAVTLPRTYHLGQPGAACAGDPPGFPSYFVRPVYTSHGNSPPRNSKCPGYVLLDDTGTLRTVPAYSGDGSPLETWYRNIYRPLPVEHPRVQAWIVATMTHHARCYADDERKEYGRPGTLVFPVPGYKLKTFTDNPRWSDTYRAAARAEVDAFNADEITRAARIATVDRHQGVMRIRRWYPDWNPPTLGWLDGTDTPKQDGNARWWEVFDEPSAAS